MRTWSPLVALCLGALVLLLDTTVVTVALPDVGRDLRAPVAALEWVPNGYTLVLAVLMLGAGAVADRVGQRRAYVAGLLLFAAASVGCAAAPTLGALVAARCVQGVGGAAVAVGGFALLATAYDGERRRVALGVFFAVNSLAAALGPVVGGLLTEGFGWRAVFVVNVPVVVVAVALCRTLPRGTPRPGGPFDLAGTALFAVAAGGLTLGLTLLATRPWPGAVAALGVAGLGAAGFVAVEAGHARPVLDVRLLATGRFGGAVLATASSSVVFAALVFTSVALQAGPDPTPLGAGLALAPLAVAAAVTSTVAGRLAVPSRWAVGGGLLVCGAGCLLQLAQVTVGLAVTGVGFGLAGPAVAGLVMAAAPPDRAGMASAAMATARQLGQTVGVAALGVAFVAGGSAAVDAVAAGAVLVGALAAFRAAAAPDRPGSRTVLRTRGRN